MNQRMLAIVLLVPFLVLTVYAVVEVGYVGLFRYQFANPGGWQVLIDLVIALVLAMIWMVADARRRGRNPWPWLLATLFLGSIGPLLYLAFGDKKAAVAEVVRES